jgi:hypothetical protein
VACRRETSHSWPTRDHSRMGTAIGPERGPAVHIRETPVAEARWAGRTGMPGKVLGRSVVVAGASCGWEDPADVSWLVARATGSSREPAVTSRRSCKLGRPPRAHPGVGLSSVASICDEEQTLLRLWLDRLGRKRYPGAPSETGFARLCWLWLSGSCGPPWHASVAFCRPCAASWLTTSRICTRSPSQCSRAL